MDVVNTLAQIAIAVLNVANHSAKALISSATLQHTVTRDHMHVLSAIKPTNCQGILRDTVSLTMALVNAAVMFVVKYSTAANTYQTT